VLQNRFAAVGKILKLAAMLLDAPKLASKRKFPGKRKYSHSNPRTKPPKLRPYSTLPNLVNVDGRTKEAQVMCQLRDELTRYCGGNPNAVQRTIIERCCWLQLRIALMDRKLTEGSFTQIDSNVYLAWVGSLRRTIAQLKPPTTVNRPNLADINAEVGLND
jgi:hypothetical protein